MSKGGTLEKISMALSGYGSALSGNPTYLQNAMMMRQMSQQEAAEREAKQNQAALAQALPMMLPGGGAPETRSFEVNGKTYGQDRAATPLLDRDNSIATLLKYGGAQFMNPMASQVMGQLFPQGFSGTLGEGDTAFQNGRKVAEGRPRLQDKKLPADVETAMFITGGNEADARAWLREQKTARENARPNTAVAQARQDLDRGLITADQYDLIVKKETALPAGSGDKTPQKYKDAVAAISSLDGTISEYESLLDKVGTEWWDADAAARLESLETQMKFGIKGLEQTGALDRGSVEVMAGMIPTATGYLANLDLRGTKKAKAKLAEFKAYKNRMKSSLASAYDPQGNLSPQTPAGATGGWSIVKEK